MPRAPRISPNLLIALWALGILTLGFLIGAAWGLTRLERGSPLTIAPDTRTGVPVIRIDGIRDGALTGTMTGNVRLVAGESIVLPDAAGVFRVTDRSLLTNMVTVRAPAGMQFVASRRGKKYYPVGSPDADRLAPENRVYFPDAGAAEQAGYLPGQ